MRRKTWLAVLGALGLVGFALLAWAVLAPADPDWAAADEVVLYSVDGHGPEAAERGKPITGETLHGYPVLGKVAVDDPAERRKLQEAFRRATADPRVQMKCFWPRHVVRLRHGDRLTEHLICFECAGYRTAVNGGHPDRGGSIDPAARPAFDAPLVAAGVGFAPE